MSLVIRNPIVAADDQGLLSSPIEEDEHDGYHEHHAENRQESEPSSPDPTECHVDARPRCRRARRITRSNSRPTSQVSDATTAAAAAVYSQFGWRISQ